MPKNPDLPCSICGRMMWRGRGSLPEGRATCRPCRQARRASAPRRPCLHCGDPLSEVQARRGGSYCSRNCAFKSGAAQIPAQRNYKRRRYPCTVRPVDLPDWDWDGLSLPPVLMPDPPPWDSDLWLQGPASERFLIVRYYDDGRVHARCLICWDEQPYDEQPEIWCARCCVKVVRHGGSA